MYDYPKEIQIGGHTHKLILIDGHWTSDEAANHSDYCQANCEIRVAVTSPNGSPESITYINECLLHELIHGIDKAYICKLEEDTIERLAQGLLQVLEQFDIRLIKLCSDQGRT